MNLTHDAMLVAKAQGKLPGAVEETVRGAHGSTVDWRTLLRRYMTDAAKSDYSRCHRPGRSRHCQRSFAAR